MNYFLGTLALLGLGFIGLLIETHKQDKKRIQELEHCNKIQGRYSDKLEFKIEEALNQIETLKKHILVQIETEQKIKEELNNK